MKLRQTAASAPGKSAVAQKELIARTFSRVQPVYLVNEYPKSGGTWLKFMLAEALGLPPWTKSRPIWGACVMQAHWLRPRGGCRTVALFRDGRDVMVSYYYHSFFRNEFQNERLVGVMRDKFQFSDYANIRDNLPRFLEVMLNEPVSPPFSWIEFVQSWVARPGVVHCRYEELRLDTPGTLVRLVRELTGDQLPADKAADIAERYSLKNMKQQKSILDGDSLNQQPAEMSFVRKGAVGAWPEHFNEESLKIFEGLAGPELRKLGYDVGQPAR